MYNVAYNLRNGYKVESTLCPLCNVSNDEQLHIFDCREILKEIGPISCQYADIYSSDPDVLCNVASELQAIVDAREKLLGHIKHETQINK